MESKDNKETIIGEILWVFYDFWRSYCMWKRNDTKNARCILKFQNFPHMFPRLARLPSRSQLSQRTSNQNLRSKDTPNMHKKLKENWGGTWRTGSSPCSQNSPNWPIQCWKDFVEQNYAKWWSLEMWGCEIWITRKSADMHLAVLSTKSKRIRFVGGLCFLGIRLPPVHDHDCRETICFLGFFEWGTNGWPLWGEGHYPDLGDQPGAAEGLCTILELQRLVHHHQRHGTEKQRVENGGK